MPLTRPPTPDKERQENQTIPTPWKKSICRRTPSKALAANLPQIINIPPNAKKFHLFWPPERKIRLPFQLKTLNLT